MSIEKSMGDGNRETSSDWKLESALSHALELKSRLSRTEDGQGERPDYDGIAELFLLEKDNLENPEEYAYRIVEASLLSENVFRDRLDWKHLGDMKRPVRVMEKLGAHMYNFYGSKLSREILEECVRGGEWDFEAAKLLLEVEQSLVDKRKKL